MEDEQKRLSSDRVGIFGPAVRNMLSKVMRSKPEVQEMNEPLRGMPALKQIRSSQRQEALWPKLASSGGHLPGNGGTKGKNIGQLDLQHNSLIHNERANGKSTLMKNQAKVAMELNEKAKQRITTNYSEVDGKMSKEPTRSPTGLQNSNGVPREDQLTNSSSSRPTLLSPSVKSQQQKSKKNAYSGRGLHSIKKERQASRESVISTSMRALTPRERESILCLEEVIEQHDQWSFGASGDENVFEDHVYEEAYAKRKEYDSDYVGEGPDNSESETSSVGSIIDLVGNLSDVRLSSSSSTRMSDSHPSDIYYGVANSNRRTTGTNSGFVTNEKDVYAQVDKNAVRAKREKTVSRQRRDDSTNKVQDELVYSVVQKNKKPARAISNESSVDGAARNDVDHETNRPSVGDEPTARSSKLFWEKISSSGSSSSRNQTPSPGSKPSSISTPTDEDSDRISWSSCEHFEKVPGSRRNQFVVVPDRSKNTSTQYCKDDINHQHTLTSADPNCKAASKIIERSKSKSKEDFSTTQKTSDISNYQRCSSVQAIPRQITLSSYSPTSPKKPFIITPASKGVYP